jgi:hypothetical protein
MVKHDVEYRKGGLCLLARTCLGHEGSYGDANAIKFGTTYLRMISFR